MPSCRRSPAKPPRSPSRADSLSKADKLLAGAALFITLPAKFVFSASLAFQ